MGNMSQVAKIICIIGTDGSGKTTLSEAVVQELKIRGVAAEKVWLGAESYLMAPVRALLKYVWKEDRRSNGGTHAESKKDAHTGYSAEIVRKNGFVSQYPWAVSIYLAILWLDYRCQVALKRWRYRKQAVIVADRYLFDVCVNIGLTLGWSPEEVVSFARRKLAHLALPQLGIFLRVPPEVSLTRKDDIPDINYLRLRFLYYEAIARAFGFIERDGTLPISENRDWLLDAFAAESARPYVLYVHANNTDIGGADKVLALMAKHMRAYGRGARVAVCLRLQTAITDSYAASGSIPVIHHPFVRPQVSRGPAGLLLLVLRAPSSLWFFWRLFGRESPNIVHVNDLYDIIPAAAAKLRGIPVVWHLRMIMTSRRMRWFFAAAVRRLASVSISVSVAVRDHYFPIQAPGHRALVVHDLGNAALIADTRDPATPSQRPEDLPQGRLLVIMIGRIEPWKGQHVFLEAVSLLPKGLRSRATFALVGGKVEAKEDYFAAITRQAQAVGVLMLGHRDDVPTLLRAADISVHASVKPDPFPGVVIESMLSGAASIAAQAGGTIEMIETGVNGTLTPPGHAEALALALTDLLENPRPPRARFGVNARRRALLLTDAGAIDAAIAEIYHNLTLPMAETH
jgi:glycosyltransferase involved in cell wall biosynthesis/thymidylate kinase